MYMYFYDYSYMYTMVTQSFFIAGYALHSLMFCLEVDNGLIESHIGGEGVHKLVP